jgi:Phosphate transport (Pho88)/Ankyrin repeats (3 copies)
MSFKGLISIPIVIALNSGYFLNLNDPQTILILRAIYVVVAGAAYFAWQTVVSKITADNDQTVIWVKKVTPPSLMSFFGGENTEAQGPSYEETTYFKYELDHANKQLQGVLVQAVINIIMSTYMKLQIPIAMQIIMLPVTLSDEALIRKYIFQVKGFLHNELLENPLERPAAEPAKVISNSTAAPSVVEASSASVSSSSTSAVHADDAFSEELIIGLWERKNEKADLATMFSELQQKGKDINYRTHDDGWTALMTVAGNPIYNYDDITSLLALGSDPTIVDQDGWTALHWAAFRGNKDALLAISDVYGSGKKSGLNKGSLEDLAHLLKQKASNGESVLDVAMKSGNEEVKDTLLSLYKKANIELKHHQVKVEIETSDKVTVENGKVVEEVVEITETVTDEVVEDKAPAETVQEAEVVVDSVSTPAEEDSSSKATPRARKNRRAD